MDANKYDWSKFEENKKACAEILKDCSTARGIIADALARYRKKKLDARSKKVASDMALMFKDLELYESEKDIQDAYGYEMISEKEMDRLIDLFRKRERFVDESGHFKDRVTDMVQQAMNAVGEEYMDFIHETEMADRINEERKSEIERGNIRFEYDRYHAELQRERRE